MSDDVLLSQAISYLKTTQGHSNLSLYDHLEFIVTESLKSDNDPSDLSILLEQSLLENQTTQPQRPSQADPTLQHLVDSYLKHVISLLQQASLPPASTTSSLLRSHLNLFALPSLSSSLSYLRDAHGLGISSTQGFLLTSSLFKLASSLSLPPENITFIGSFFTLNSPYYAIEIPFSIFPHHLLPSLQPALPGEIPPEPWGEGCNEVVIMVVTQDSLVKDPSSWEILPPVYPKFVSNSVNQSLFLTGNLSTSVPYYQSEANFLRSFISVLSHSSFLCPNGLFVEDEDGQVVANDEFDLEEWQGLVEENWVHCLAHLLPQGRVSYSSPVPFPKPPKKDEDEEDESEEEEEEPELKERFMGVENDVLIKETDDDEGQEEGQEEVELPLFLKMHIPNNVWNFKSKHYLKSVKYPGLINLFSNGKFGSIYFGNCTTFSLTFHSPSAIPTLQTFPSLPTELRDPTLIEEHDWMDKKREEEEEEEQEEEDD
ncbi:hypothetical protein P9112_014066 [Eukaryota sp. TZLM1-RC]